VDSGPVCDNPDVKCGEGSCSHLVWNFDSGGLDGITFRASSGQPLAVRVFDGDKALAVDVAQLNVLPEVSFALPVCAASTVDLSARTLSFRVYFDGTPPSSYEFYVDASVPESDTGGYLDQISAGTGAWTDYSSPLSKSPFSSSTKQITIRAGSVGGSFTGTIWFDDFEIR
jgi:hypothetical protein